MFIPSWPNVYIVTDEDRADCDAALALVERLEAAKPPPEVPPPCWDNRPIDCDRAMEAVRAMCG